MKPIIADIEASYDGLGVQYVRTRCWYADLDKFLSDWESGFHSDMESICFAESGKAFHLFTNDMGAYRSVDMNEVLLVDVEISDNLADVLEEVRDRRDENPASW